MNVTSSNTRRGGARSHRGGVPTVVSPWDDAGTPSQLTLPVGVHPPEGERVELLTDAVHVSGWLNLDAQRALAAEFRRWAVAPAGLRHPRVPTGQLMSVQSVCLGWHWQPYAYTRTADDTDGAPVKPLPPHVAELARRAVAAAFGADKVGSCAPDAAIVNLYSPGARLGIHKDGEEPSDAPVVTISLGDSCTFRFAGVGRRTGPFVDVELHSGDLLVFGGVNRRIFQVSPRSPSALPRRASGFHPDA